MSVNVFLEGVEETITDLHMSASFSKSMSFLADSGSLSIINMRQETRSEILTNANFLYERFGAPKTVPRVEVYAGTGDFVNLIFSGDVVSCSVSPGPDVMLVMNCMANMNSSTVPSSRSLPGPIKVSEISSSIANDLGKSLSFHATDKEMSSYSYSGNLLAEQESIKELGDYSSYIDGDLLVVQDRDRPLEGFVRLISEDTGLIGVPERNELGVVVKTFFDGSVRVGGQIDVVSSVNPSANGRWFVRKIDYILSNYQDDFYSIIHAGRF
jgi:hypothetical protein